MTVKLLALAHCIRKLADDVWVEAKRPDDEDRKRLLLTVAAELHRLGRLIETWVEGGGKA